jgi:D-sedoheptulose 7-phosphate isomerase
MEPPGLTNMQSSIQDFGMNFFKKYYEDISTCIGAIENEPSTLAGAAALFAEVKGRGGKVILVGNGGSAAMASHVSVDLTKVSRLRAINFNEADLITCFANDYGHEQWMAQALEFYADPQDLVVLISSSGKSPNVINAAVKAKQMKLPLITFSGFAVDNPLRKLGDINFWVDSHAYNVVEMTHHVWLLSLADKLVDDAAPSLMASKIG